ncbi:L-histidine N(alpha)-methyltransferase [Planktothricoides raciborskii]|uniref:L-histidine N(Alpha)-methyltransferase n=2 Tax=Planktothricoides raciborskii TaxID=132608 RepID=A0AAU8J973_9CYAN|nr:L-histidine N(alpha)-methyltransferase [Planktothricoides raciborskii]MBD2543014.1 L-histidine N(alpha)-methyltransferase [Planktothricoides raciborskii FACHB-1370]MBD2581893.1 L-histidine N(alpha)-methyltransferase [Planktothricoides raciborskii FACHB-1261]
MIPVTAPLNVLKANPLEIVRIASDRPSAAEITSNHGEDIVWGLTQNPKSIPPKYFYDDRGSDLFEQICELPEYYPTRTEAAILAQYAGEIAQITGPSELVELGSGSSSKTRLLLDAYQGLGHPSMYVPIDVSGGILEASAKQLAQEYPGLHIRGLVGTYEQALLHLPPTKFASRVIIFLGSSLGNFTPEECDRFFEEIHIALREEDYFLLGVDLQKPHHILEPAYNDAQGVTAEFNLNMLSHLNWRFGGNFNLNLFSHEAIYNQEASQIEMYLNCHKSHQVRLEKLDFTVQFSAGESILTEISRKFDFAHKQEYLKDRGLKLVKAWTDPKEWFGLLLCQK